MASLETSVFCSAAEYNQGRPKRANEQSLGEDDIYNLAVLLDSETRPAAKLAVQTQEISHGAGFVAVRFAFLDGNLKPTIQTEQVLYDGLINAFSGIVIVDTGTTEKYNIVQAYFKDFFDDQIIEALAQSAELATAGL